MRNAPSTWRRPEVVPAVLGLSKDRAAGPEELIAAIREAEGLQRATARRFRPPE
jgi:hypothetical protein